MLQSDLFSIIISDKQASVFVKKYIYFIFLRDSCKFLISIHAPLDLALHTTYL